MTNILRVSDGNKAASFDGFVVEVFGLSGSITSRRIAIESIEDVTVAGAADQLMFGVRSGNKVHCLFVSPAKRAEWDSFANAIKAARAALSR
jgi:hypothetical protein